MKRIILITIIVGLVLPDSVCMAQLPIPKPDLSKQKPNPTLKYEDVTTLKRGEKYSKVYDYGSNGLALVEVKRPYGSGKKYGMIDREGRLVVPLTYDYIGDYHSDSGRVWREHQKLLRVEKDVFKNGYVVTKKMGYIDASGKVLIPLIYSYVSPWVVVTDKDPFIILEKNGKWGCLKPDGSELISLVYDEMDTSYNEDYPIRMRKDGKWGLFIPKTNELLPCIYDEMGKFYRGYPLFAKKNGKYGLIDMQGKEITPFKYSTAGEFHSNRAVVSIDGKYGYVNWLGNEVIPLEYEMVNSFDDLSGWNEGKYAIAIKNGKAGIIDRKGNVVIPFEYDADTNRMFGFFDNSDCKVAVLKKNGKYGVVNHKNEEILPFIYSLNDCNSNEVKLYPFSGDSYKDMIFIRVYGVYKIKKDYKVQFCDSIIKKEEYKTASEWFLKAAKQGHAGAYLYLGWMAEFGKGRESSYIDAAKLYEEAVKRDNASAMDRLGNIYYYGKVGNGRDYQRAFRLFMQAADHLDSDAMYYLGWMYEYGQGTEKDMNKALLYYRKSSHQGNVSATERIRELQSKETEKSISK